MLVQRLRALPKHAGRGETLTPVDLERRRLRALAQAGPVASLMDPASPAYTDLREFFGSDAKTPLVVGTTNPTKDYDEWLEFELMGRRRALQEWPQYHCRRCGVPVMVESQFCGDECREKFADPQGLLHFRGLWFAQCATCHLSVIRGPSLGADTFCSWVCASLQAIDLDDIPPPGNPQWDQVVCYTDHIPLSVGARSRIYARLKNWAADDEGEGERAPASGRATVLDADFKRIAAKAIAPAQKRKPDA